MEWEIFVRKSKHFCDVRGPTCNYRPGSDSTYCFFSMVVMDRRWCKNALTRWSKPSSPWTLQSW
jgi:hypothetical protein